MSRMEFYQELHEIETKNDPPLKKPTTTLPIQFFQEQNQKVMALNPYVQQLRDSFGFPRDPEGDIHMENQ